MAAVARHVARPLSVRPLTEVERQVLRDSLRSPDAFVLRRAQIVLASAAGERTGQIAPRVGLTTQGVRDVIHAFNARGLEVLCPGSHHPGVVSSALDTPRALALRDLLDQSPRHFNTPTGVWTLELAAEVADEQGVTATCVSGVTIRSTLTRMDVRWRRVKEWITSPDPEYADKRARHDHLIRLAQQYPEWLFRFADEARWSRLAHPALHAWQGDDHPWRLIEQTVARDDPVTVQVTAEDDPAVQVTAEDDPALQAAAAVALAVRTASGVAMDVQPTDAVGRAATFRLTYHNHSPAPVAIALLAHDNTESLRVRPEPAEPVVVPGDSAGSIAVHVVPKVRPLVGVPHAYGIVFRAQQLWTVPEGQAELVREARFTYMPYLRPPALARVLVWGRRLPVWIVALALVLLVLLLVLAGDRTLATATRTAGMRTPASTQPAVFQVVRLAHADAPAPSAAAPGMIVIHISPRTAVVGQAELFSALLSGQPHIWLTYILHYPDGHEDHIPVRTDGHGYASYTFHVSPYQARSFRETGTVGVEDAYGRVLAYTHVAIQQH